MKRLTRTLNKIAYARQRRLKLKRNPAAKRSGVKANRGTGANVESLPDQS